MAGFDRCHTDTSAVFVPSRHSACNSLRQQNGSIHGIPWSRKAPAQSRPLPAPSGFGSASARHSQLRFIIPHASSLRQKNGGSVRKNPGGDTHYTGSGYSRPVSAPALKSSGNRAASAFAEFHPIRCAAQPPSAAVAKQKNKRGDANATPSVTLSMHGPCQSKKLSSSAIPGSVGRSAGSISSSQS